MKATEKKAFALALGVGYGLATPAFADLVVLRNGDQLEGNVTGQTIAMVNFVGDDGRVQMLPKSTISTIFYFSRKDKDKQEAKLTVLKKEEERKEREEKLKKKREEERERREKELKEKREKERREALEKKKEAEEALKKEREERDALEEKKEEQDQKDLQERKRQQELERRRQEALRLEKTEGLVRLWSGQEIHARIIEQKGEVFTLETTAGLMDFDRSEIEEMEIVSTESGTEKKRILQPAELEAVASPERPKDAVRLSGGDTIHYKSVAYDGYNAEVESEYGQIRLRPEDSSYGYNEKPDSGLELNVGQYGFVMLRTGQKVSGDLMLRSKHEWVLATDHGEIHLSSDEIIFARSMDRPASWSVSDLMFWR
ncbi:MAG: hypothetical protein KDK25_09210 [Leptospiraceae bacterium]|nr:hypothetical protein [Leptospiraceae bacterium]